MRMKKQNVCTGIVLCTGILIITNRHIPTVFYEFIIGNKHEVLGSKTKLWESGAKPHLTEAIGDLEAEPPGFGDF